MIEKSAVSHSGRLNQNIISSVNTTSQGRELISRVTSHNFLLSVSKVRVGILMGKVFGLKNDDRRSWSVLTRRWLMMKHLK